ncbi:hypothetical protein ACFLUD_02490 [Chloroflexota bacterium]
MIRLEKSEVLQRKIRQDDVAEMGIPTWTLVRETIQAGKTDEALDFLEYGLTENQAIQSQLVAFVNDTLTYLARFGEEEILKVIRHRYDKRLKERLSQMSGLVETLQIFLEGQRAQFGNLSVVEEPDRYVMSQDPCGSIGKLWRTRSVGTTKQAYPWSWSKSGVPYYCVHCCAQEIIATELRGYPVVINLSPEKPEDPCVRLFYKKPELIPEEYFTRIGMTKTIK